MYDWANSAFQSTIITAVFPDFFEPAPSCSTQTNSRRIPGSQDGLGSGGDHGLLPDSLEREDPGVNGRARGEMFALRESPERFG